MAVVGEVFVAVKPEPGAATSFGKDTENALKRATSSIGEAVGKAIGVDMADNAGPAFTRGLDGRLRDDRGKFVSTGRVVGDAIGDGVSQTADDKITSGFRGISGKIIGIFAAAGIGIALGAAIRSVTDEFAESAKIGRLTEAVITSTGGAAGLSAAQFNDLATAISNKTGIDDEQIQSSENVLATFTNVTNAIGDGNDVFTQATGLIADMSAALGTDLQGATIQVGKALNDPIKGVTALQKVGVSFTESQKDQIRTLVESGQTLEAQKIILGELSKEFGGAAEAAADPIQRLKVIIGNAKETIGGAIFPVIGAVADSLASVLPTLATTIGTALQSVVGGFLLPLVQQIAPVLSTVVNALAPVIESIGGALGPIIGAISTAINALAPALAPIGVAIGDILTAVGSALGALAPLLGPIAQLFVQLVQTIVAALLPAFNAFVEVITPIVQAILPPLQQVLTDLQPVFREIAGVIGNALVIVIRTLGDALQQLLPALTPLIAAFARFVSSVLLNNISVLARLFVTLVNAVKPLIPIIVNIAGVVANVLTKAFDALAPILGQVTQIIGEVLAKVIKAIAPSLPELGRAFEQIAVALGQVLIAIVPILPPLVQLVALLIEKIGVPQLVLMAEAFTAVAVPLAQLAAIVAQILSAGLQELAAILVDIVGTVASLNADQIVSFFNDIVNGLEGGASDGLDAFLQFFRDLPGNILTALGDLVGLFTGVGEDIVNAIGQGLVNAIDSVLQFFRDLPGKILDFQFSLFLAGAGLAQSIIDGLANLLSGAGGAIAEALKTVVNAVIGGINDIIDTLNQFEIHIHLDIPLFPDIDFDFDGLHLRHIPRLAKGSPSARGLNIVGDAGPELIDFGDVGARVFPAGQLQDQLTKALINVGLDHIGGGEQSNVVNIGSVNVAVRETPEQAALATIAELESAQWLAGAG